MEINKVDINLRLRIAGILIVLGLVVELLTLAWNHPISFLVFLGVGGFLIFVGIIVYLYSLVSEEQNTSDVRHG